jgi:hypothetical protein
VPRNIKDPADDKALREHAAEEPRQWVHGGRDGRRLAAKILDIGRRCAALPDLDPR